MDDDELAALRQQRLAQLRSEDEKGNSQRSQQQEERARAIEDQKSSILGQILTQDARERLSRVQMVKPDSARLVSDHLIMLAQNGSLKSKIDGPQLVKLLEQVQASTQPSQIKIQRKGEDEQVFGGSSARKRQDDSDDSDNFDSSDEDKDDDRDD